MNKTIQGSPIAKMVELTSQNLKEDWQGSILAIHEDGGVSKIDVGFDANGTPAIEVTPVVVYAK